MEDLWKVQDSDIEVENFADIVIFKRFLDRFCKDEEDNHRRRLLYGDEDENK
jgi:hypothetical protein